MLKKVFLILFLLYATTSRVAAFLDSDLGLNLYKEIDKGMVKLETTQLDYELKGGEKTGNVSENLNNQLNSDGLKKCLNSGLTTSKVEDILDKKDVKSLYKSISSECKENGLSILDVNNYMTGLNKYRNEAKKRAKNKSKKIFEIAQIGLYTDGTLDNSPFDLIVDLQEIDKIIFGEELDYEGEEMDSDFLDDFEEDPFIDGNIIDEEDEDDENNNGNNDEDNKNNNGDNNDENNNGNNDEEIINNDDNNDLTQIPDGNNYVCPQNNDNSGLDPDELTDLKDDISGNNGDINFIFRTTPDGHIKLPITNVIGVPDGPPDNIIYSGTIDEYIAVPLDGDYTEVDDNEQWKCTPDSFFCITIEFITSNHKGLGYGKSKSIEEVIKMSNKHLKKGVNTSLVQAKMGTNNFENILRDLDFSKMFHMGIIISKKVPPFLKLNRNFKKNGGDSEDKKEKEYKYKKYLTEVYKSQGLDYERKNDLTILGKKEKKLRDTIDIAELNPSSLAKKEQQRDLILKHLNVENEVQDSTKDQFISKGQLQEFYKEFTEYEKFISALETYSESIAGYVKVLHDKPRGD